MAAKEIDYPIVMWKDGDMWMLSYIEDGITKRFSISKRNVGILARSIGECMEREYRPTDLIYWQKRVAI